MKRTRKATVRLTEDELGALKAAAAESGWSQEAYLRSLIAGLRPAPRPSADFRAMTRELRRIGVNLNQMARCANAGSEVDREALRGTVERLERSVAEIVDTVTAPRRL